MVLQVPRTTAMAIQKRQSGTSLFKEGESFMLAWWINTVSERRNYEDTMVTTPYYWDSMLGGHR
jgi:hypothetical protein